MRRYFFRRLELSILVVFSVIVMFCILNYLPDSYLPIDCSNLSNNIKNKKYLKCLEIERLKSIQVLTHFYDWKDWQDEQLGTKPFEKCREKRCFAFRYESSRQKPLEESNGVIVHAPNLFYMPSRSTYRRNPKQLWSLFTIESQRYSFCLIQYKLNDLDDWFNMTKTVKDNYAYMPYDLKQIANYEIYRKAYLKRLTISTTSKKKRLALWLVSHCETPNKRESLAVELAKYTSDNLDIFGACQFDNYSRPDPCKKAHDKKKCLIDLFNSYKFYLSFENSNCDLYITEKYFNFYEPETIFNVDIVPIVRGASYTQYLDRAPHNHSFIYADNFASVKSLAEYILYLDRNNSAYLEYFRWKKDLYKGLEQQKNDLNLVLLKKNEFEPLCDLCEKLHDQSFMNNSNNQIVKISEFYNPVKDCSKEAANEKIIIHRLKDNCYWAMFHFNFRWFWVNFYRKFILFY